MFLALAYYTSVSLVYGNAVSLRRAHEHGVKVLVPRAVVTCSNSAQNAFITSGYNEARALANAAASPSVCRLFGTNNASAVVTKYLDVANGSSASRTLNCSDPYGDCTSGVIVYTTLTEITFYNEVPTSNLCSGTAVGSPSLRGGVIIKELLLNEGLDNVTYGCSADQALSNSNKFYNADNYVVRSSFGPPNIPS
ncbi:hypothetical protein CPB83DRAFT_899304 [Crepidotus variabilis]|uniref:Uncharacterized protein n=1 Tax=Crepidotus variabilis TaxID=179855 RepID=A0A9P6JJ17_9AGAR|nr:hypothetical protein CPB83DRAFT_899304 [Crepidotus variabilis]